MNQLFIVGVGRSGTSLLQSMLASHSSIAYSPETSFIRRFVSKLKCEKILQSSDKNNLIKLLMEDEYIKRLGISKEEFQQIKFEKNISPDIQVYNFLLSYVKGTISWVGDKDPRAIEYLPLLLKLNPAIKIIHIVRDPRDILLSKKNAAWSKNGHAWKHILANICQYRLGRKYSKNPNYIEIKYEDLISNPDSQLKSICNKLNINFEIQMLDFGTAARTLVAKSEVSWKKETFGPLLKDNLNKWEIGLHKREIYLIQKCCADIFTINNYKILPQITSLNVKDKLWIIMGSLLINVFSPFYITYREYSVNSLCKKLKGE
jgi:hypothetical protein